MNKSIVNRLCTLLLLAMCFTKLSASQTVVAHWEFTTGYDVEKSGKTATYTPNTLGWSKIANTYWKTTQPYFHPNQCALVPEDCYITVHTSDGKWEVTSSGSGPNYLLRLNTASITKFTAKADYADGSKHDQYFEISMPTLSLSNLKLNFSIGDGSSSATKFGVVYSVDGGTTWTVLDDYTSGSHWNTYVDANYDLNADNKERLIVRLLIQSATKTSNYNLKYVNILAEDTQVPKVLSTTPADGATDVIPTGKAVILFSEVVEAKANAAAVLRNNASGVTTELSPVIKGNKVSFAYTDLDLTTSYTLTVAAGAFADLAGNVLVGVDDHHGLVVDRGDGRIQLHEELVQIHVLGLRLVVDAGDLLDHFCLQLGGLGLALVFDLNGIGLGIGLDLISLGLGGLENGFDLVLAVGTHLRENAIQIGVGQGQALDAHVHHVDAVIGKAVIVNTGKDLLLDIGDPDLLGMQGNQGAEVVRTHGTVGGAEHLIVDVRHGRALDAHTVVVKHGIADLIDHVGLDHDVALILGDGLQTSCLHGLQALIVRDGRLKGPGKLEVKACIGDLLADGTEAQDHGTAALLYHGGASEPEQHQHHHDGGGIFGDLHAKRRTLLFHGFCILHIFLAHAHFPPKEMLPM